MINTLKLLVILIIIKLDAWSNIFKTNNVTKISNFNACFDIWGVRLHAHISKRDLNFRDVGCSAKNKETVNLCLWQHNHCLNTLVNTWHVCYTFMYIYDNWRSMVFSHFVLCSRVKLRPRDAVFGIKFSFQVKISLFCHSVNIFIKPIHVKQKNY